MCCIVTLGYAQPAPTCLDLNIAIEADDSSTITVGEFVTNADLSLPDITIENPYGGVIAFVADADAATVIRIASCPYASRELKLVAKNDQGACWSRITFKQDNGPIIVGRKTDVYCDDPLIESGAHIGGVPPTATLPCTGDVPANYVADWVEVYDCVLGEDTAKVIYRMYDAYDKFGHRGTGQDTIVVRRLPQISANNVFCAERDTTYCGEGSGEEFGPFMVFDELDGQDCDTLFFLNPDGTPASIDPKCGISVAVSSEKFGEGCVSSTKYVVEIKQSCYGAPGTCTVDGSMLETVADGYFKCTFWLMDIDTVPPEVTCDIPEDTIVVPTGVHDCAAHLAMPDVIASDICHDVKSVKASIEGYGSFAYESNGDGTWSSHIPVRLPYVDGTVMVVIEAMDDCHNVKTDTCWIRVKDLSAPVAACDKGVNISLTGKKVWVSAQTFDEGSWDNCGVNMLLARRSDWKEACVDLCDNVVAVGETGLYRPVLETNPLENETEAYYANTMDWLRLDDQPCGDLLHRAWRYDLMKHATLECEDPAFHGSDFDTEAEALLGSEYFDKVRQIGGGWGADVMFSCDDACKSVTVELLVMDYWCNWNKCWTDVWVEDKTPVTVVKDVVTEFDVSCASFKEANITVGGVDLSLADLVEHASEGSQSAKDALDAIFGGYQKAWAEPNGTFVDAAGDEIDCDIIYNDKYCQCNPTSSVTQEYDEHLGWIDVTTEGRVCEYIESEAELNHGLIAVNCAENVNCDQDVWYQFDQCGQGVVYRKFKIYQGCPSSDLSHSARDTVTRIQKIWVGPRCPLDEGMFVMPDDATVEACGIEYDPDGSGNVGGDLHPDVLGRPEYIFDNDCRLVGIGYYDKVYRIVGGDEACFKVVRTWCFADWCNIEKPISEDWIYDPRYEKLMFKYDQQIIVTDDVPPAAVINPINSENTVQASGCSYDFSTTVDVADACGVLSYTWRLTNAKGDIIATGNDNLDLSMGDSFEVSADGLEPGRYTVSVSVTDACQNEGVTSYTFDIFTGKKPSPVCITSLTVELTPMDTDNDGAIDTGMAIIWASEFNSSSIPACNDESVEFYIEYLDGIGDETLDELDEDHLDIGCDVLPDPFVVRMWVKSIPSGTSDYCDVIIVPQNNMNACGDVSSTQSNISGSITTELNSDVEQVDVIATLSNGTEFTFLTQSSGSYRFASALGLDVTITPTKDTDHMNGISTSDLIKIQKHLLAKDLLEGDYRRKAADVNVDGKISALDMLLLRKLILGKIDQLPNTDSWVFINEIDGSDSYTIKDMRERSVVDFTGVKMGDVDISNDPTRGAARSGNALELVTQDVQIQKGTKHIIDITADNFNRIEGYQFTLNVDPGMVAIGDVIVSEELGITDDNFGFELIDQGILTTSWNDGEARTFDAGIVLFSIELEGLNEGSLSQVMAINSKVTDAEAYNANEEIMDVSIRFEGEVGTSGFELFQNRPNPFKDLTTIGFSLPKATSATLTVFDVTGKVLRTVEGDFVKGYNAIDLLQSELNATGVLYYQLDSDTFTATRRMVVID